MESTVHTPPIVGMEKLSLLDYPNKLSTILFLPGCNMNCPFCHNSELIHTGSYTTIPFDDVLDYLSKRKNVIDGVVITGGEPTLHKDTLDILFQAIRKLGLSIKIDTNGLKPDVIKYWLSRKYIDYIAMDIKNCERKYALTCGKHSMIDPMFPEFAHVIESIGIIMNSHINYEFRTTVIEHIHTEDDIYDIVTKLIPGSDRYVLQPFVMRDTVPDKTLCEPSDEMLIKCLNIAKQYVKYASVRGRDI